MSSVRSVTHVSGSDRAGLAEEAVWCEPLSVSNSLVAGKNTGIWAGAAGTRRRKSVEHTFVRRTSCHWGLADSSLWQGITKALSGKSPAPSREISPPQILVESNSMELISALQTSAVRRSPMQIFPMQSFAKPAYRGALDVRRMPVVGMEEIARAAPISPH